MIKRKSKAFTLIELIATLVIMAIIALIVTPLVMSIIRSARISADKRSIDAYGRSIELAIASYLLDNGKFPTSIGELTIEYSGNEVVCETTQLNTDSSVYLAGCRVAGRSVDYAYGTDKSPTYTAYVVGDKVSYNNITYYVIEDSNSTNDTVKLLKENPITKTEMYNLNLIGIGINDINGYGGVEYGTTTDYSTSTVKQVVDAWVNTAVKSGDIVTARLITFDELTNNLNYVLKELNCGGCGVKTWMPSEITPSWLYNSNYLYWTMSEKDLSNVWYVNVRGELYGTISVFENVRPVLELNKSAEITRLAS